MKHDASAGVVRMWFLRLHFFARILHVMPAVEVCVSDAKIANRNPNITIRNF
jgi:hypothetical protein